MQAPHNPAPQPNLVPFSFKPTRITQSNVVSGCASVDARAPFTTNVIINSSLTGTCPITPPRKRDDHAGKPVMLRMQGLLIFASLLLYLSPSEWISAIKPPGNSTIAARRPAAP